MTVSNDQTDLSSALQAMVNDYNTFQSALTFLHRLRHVDRYRRRPGQRPDGHAARLGSLQPDERHDFRRRLDHVVVAAWRQRQLGRLALLRHLDVQQRVRSRTPTRSSSSSRTRTNGFAVQLDNLMTQVAGSTNSLLSGQVSSLASMVTDNNNQINSLNTMLGDEQTRLYNEFYNMELAIEKLQTNMGIVDTFSLLNSDGSSTNVFSDTDASSLGSNLANIIESLASSAAAESQFQQQFQQLTISGAANGRQRTD